MRYTILMLMLVLAPFVSASNWDTHRAFAGSVYYNLNDSLRENLSLSLMEEGSIIPDKIFQDYKKHSFPLSYIEAKKWLQKTKTDLENKDYKNASLDFGIASHYIVDSFSSPHSFSGEDYASHKEYEDQASSDYLYAACNNEKIKLQDALYTGSLNGGHWITWTETRDRSLPFHDVENAMNHLFPIAMETFGSRCRELDTKVEAVHFYLGWKEILLSAAVLIGIILTGFSLRKDLKNS